MADEKILIVDDEAHIRRLCAEILRRRSYRTVTVASSRSAIEEAQSGSYDVILADISLPEMDGLSLVQAVKNIQKEIAAVIMTGYGTLDNAIQAIRLGAQGFVVKPFSQQELIQSIEDALEKHRLLRENMRLKTLVPLFELNKTMLSELHLQALLDTVARVALRETRSDLAGVLMWDEAAGRFEPRSAVHSGGEVPDALFHLLKEPVGQWISDRRSQLIMMRRGSVQDDLKPILSEAGLSSLAVIPLVAKERAVGALVLGIQSGTAVYNPADLELVSILCGQATIAVENAKMFELVQAKNRELETYYFETVSALAQAIEVKDNYTGGHGDRLSDLAIGIAERLGIPDHEKVWLKYAAALHDIGKIGIKETILTKQGKLTPEEYDEMKKHPAKGAEILREIRFLSPVVPIVYHHQEQYDGRGYPDGLAGEAIPIGARIVAVLDAFDAMTTNRPYRRGLPLDTALGELRRYSGVQFDPRVVDAFIDVVHHHPPHTA